MGCLRLVKDGKPAVSIPLLKNYPIKIGRDEDKNDVVIFDPSISRSHARISFEEGHYVIEDLGSRYGTYVNNSKIDGKTILADNCQVLIGSTLLQFAARQYTSPDRPSSSPTQESIFGEPSRTCPNEMCAQSITDKFQFCPHCGSFL